MSVELTGTAIDILPVKPPQVQNNEHQAIKEFTDSTLSVENKLIRANEAEETQRIHNVSEETAQQEKVMTVHQLENVAKQLQEFIGTMNRGLEFSVDEDSGRDVIKVIDKESGDIIKQYPSEEVLSLVAKLSEAIGNFVDSKV
ncbi:flagellar protein FlaG [Colwellia sp. TT2012]|uniref:flagellar protein FlaG n=1 Tax=Colwellia sp. TT2012 TaxID=1720342 RepID=UPI0007106C7B|nr:flagellar protein FlaG [Colwellia sp. TT2012]